MKLIEKYEQSLMNNRSYYEEMTPLVKEIMPRSEDDHKLSAILTTLGCEGAELAIITLSLKLEGFDPYAENLPALSRELKRYRKAEKMFQQEYIRKRIKL